MDYISYIKFMVTLLLHPQKHALYVFKQLFSEK